MGLASYNIGMSISNKINYHIKKMMVLSAHDTQPCLDAVQMLDSNQ